MWVLFVVVCFECAPAAHQDQKHVWCPMLYIPQKPATLEEAVEQMVALRLEKEKELLAASYKAKEEVLVQKIQGLEAKIPSGGKTPTGGKK